MARALTSAAPATDSQPVRARGLAVAVAAAVILAGPAAAQTVHYGGTITIGSTLGPNALDPTVSTDPTLAGILPAFCLPLYTYASNHGTLELDPILAAAPPAVSTDKLTYTIQLRQGIRFNDGTPFDAEAVVDSFLRYTTDPDSVHKSDFPGVDRATEAGPYTVVYHLTQRNSAFTGNLLPLSPTAIAKEGSGFFSNPICVGPFTVDSWTPGDNVTLVKSQYYYKRGAVYLDKIVYKVIPSQQAKLAALQAGDVQVLANATPPPPSSNLKMIRSLSAGWTGLVFNIGNKNGVGNLPYANVGTPLARSAKLRRAFEEAIDRSTDAEVAFAGLVNENCTLIPPWDAEWYLQTRVPCTPVDPKDAKRLVAASGYPLPITIHLLIVAGGTGLEAQLIQSEEAAVGFNVVIDVLAGPAFSNALYSGNFEAAVTGPTTPTDSDPNSYIYNVLDTAGSRNFSGYSNPRLDYVLANALRATDQRARAVDYRVAQEIVHEDRPIVPIREPVSYAMFDSSLKGIETDAFGHLIVVNAQYK
jgi:peptide/nickel transport system substrate-binding protein